MNDSEKRNLAASAETILERIQNGHTHDGDESTPIERKHVQDSEDGPVTDVSSMVDIDSPKPYKWFKRWPSDEPLPRWVSTVEGLIETFRESDVPASLPSYLDENHPFPEFSTVVVRFTKSNRRQINDPDYIASSALRDMDQNLAEQVTTLAARTLHADYLSYVSSHDPSLIEDDGLSADSTDWYDEYIEALHAGRISSVFHEFPMLARLLGQTIQMWSNATQLFVDRLSEDYSAVCSLCDGENPGEVVHIDASAGDRHAGGKTVYLVEFETGEEVVYKPRDVRPEDQLYEFTEWLHERFPEFPRLQAPAVVSREKYGWVEKVAQGSFTSTENLSQYYRRAGALLYVLYLLNASDCHFENVVASSDSPILVDAETILQGTPKGTESDFESKLQEHILGSSLLSTMMLPFEKEGLSNNMSGLGMLEAKEARLPAVTWHDVNTDAIDLEIERKTVEPEQNFPRYEGEPLPPEQFTEAIADGFKTAYMATVDSNEVIEQRILESFSDIPVRVVFQQSLLYQALLDTLSSPKYLRDAVRFENRILETLGPDESAANWRDGLLRAEHRAILNRDIPRFTVRTDQTSVRFRNDIIVEDVFEEKPIETVRSRCSSLSERDAAFQAGLVRACLGNARENINQENVRQ